MLKKVFDFFIFTSFFIACCAVLMVYQAALLFHLPLPFSLYAFVFLGSVCSYNFHWYLTPPSVAGTGYKYKWNVNNRQLHLYLFLFGLTGSGVAAFFLLPYWFWLCITALFTFLYSAPKIEHPLFTWLRKIAVAKTIYLAFAWMQVTCLLPVIIAKGTLTPMHNWYLVNRFFFIYAICIVFDRRDVESDRKAGIKSLITYFDEKQVDFLFWFSIAAVVVTCIILGQWFPWMEVFILFFPSLIMSFLYYPSKKNHSDYLYYFLLDGLMALSAPILILAKFAR